MYNLHACRYARPRRAAKERGGSRGSVEGERSRRARRILPSLGPPEGLFDNEATRRDGREETRALHPRRQQHSCVCMCVCVCQTYAQNSAWSNRPISLWPLNLFPPTALDSRVRGTYTHTHTLTARAPTHRHTHVCKSVRTRVYV
jgi:hypothetical protein